MKHHSELTWPQVAMAANAPMLTRACLVEGDLDAGILPTGQVVGSIEALPTVADLIAQIVAEAEATLTLLAGFLELPGLPAAAASSSASALASTASSAAASASSSPAPAQEVTS